VNLSEYLAALRKRWLVILALLLVGGAAGYGYTMSLTPQYRASTTVFLSLSRAGSVGDLVQGSTYTQGVVLSYAQVATTPVVLAPVITQLGLPVSPAQLAAQVSADAPQNTTLITITATSTSPAQSAQIANAVGDQLSRAVAQLSPGSSSSKDTITVTTVSPATVPTSQASPSRTLNVGGGVLLGLLAAVAFAVLREVLDTRVRTSDDVRRTTDTPVLGTVGYERSSSNRLLIAAAGHTQRAEAFRQLRTNLQYLNHSGGLRTVVVTSASAGEGKTTTATNLAWSMAAAGQRVLLVDADLRRPAVAAALGLEGNVGLSTVLIGRAEVADVVQSWGEHGLHVLPAGRVPPNPSELLSSERMTKLLAQAGADYDLVVLDAAPLLPVTDPAVLSRIADGAILVVNTRKTTRDQLTSCTTILSTAGARLLGVVLNQAVVDKKSSYYGNDETTPVPVEPTVRPGARRAHAPDRLVTAARTTEPSRR
jgi:succinoglycan biosynthesis transport protein ExoP